MGMSGQGSVLGFYIHNVVEQLDKSFHLKVAEQMSSCRNVYMPLKFSN